MERLNQRKSPRVTLNLLAGETLGGKYFLPLLSNISYDGVYLENPAGQDMPCSHATILEIILPGAAGIIKARCRVVREQKKGFFRGRALEFIDISALDRNSVRLFVQRCAGIV